MTAQDIEYSEKYFDDEFEYRCATPAHTPALCISSAPAAAPLAPGRARGSPSNAA
tara:strand:+ start:408 stop:572 length:165 start_codon:yes stop_codon:yes gene_type:complete